jgi:hypothetical protein
MNFKQRTTFFLIKQEFEKLSDFGFTYLNDTIYE